VLKQEEMLVLFALQDVVVMLYVALTYHHRLMLSRVLNHQFFHGLEEIDQS
jgi:hypothetical protein